MLYPKVSRKPEVLWGRVAIGFFAPIIALAAFIHLLCAAIANPVSSQLFLLGVAAVIVAIFRKFLLKTFVQSIQFMAEKIARRHVYRAYLHAFKPREAILSPALHTGERVFWINVKINSVGAVPLDSDQQIHWQDAAFGVRKPNAIGAPHYRWVESNDKVDRLAIMGVVYTLKEWASVNDE